MVDSLETTALLIYNECLEWVIDYLENEVDFQTTLINFENSLSKFYIDNSNLKDCLDDKKYYILLNIESLLEHRVITLYGHANRYRLSERDLKDELEFILSRT